MNTIEFRNHLKQILVLVALSSSAQAYAVSCGDYITRDITLKANLNCSVSTGYNAINVVANNITIDLNGFTLSGDSGLAGIAIYEHENLTVKNGIVIGFWAGVNATRSNKLTINNVNFQNVGVGITSQGSNNAVIRDNKFIQTRSRAISLSASFKGYSTNHNTISNNEFFRANSAITICGGTAQYNKIINNLIWKSADHGIHLNNSSWNQIRGNHILESGDHTAIRLHNASYNEIGDNTLMEGGHAGLSILTGSGTCFNTGENRSLKNQIIGNRFWNFPKLVTLGLGVGSPRNVEGNRLAANRLSNADIGIFFNTDTRDNTAEHNVLTEVAQEIEDFGVNNSY